MIVGILAALAFQIAVNNRALSYMVLLNQTRLSDYSFANTDPSSESGFVLGMRNDTFPGMSVDACQWIMHTQRMIARGDWRIHATDIDGQPTGREIHWSSFLMWWIAWIALIYSHLSGLTWAQSVAPAAIWANPLLLGILLLTVPFAVGRRFGPLCGGVFALLMGTVSMFGDLFSMLAPDHHGLALMGGMLAMLFAVSAGGGWTATDAGRSQAAAWFPVPLHRAKRDFLFSGLWAAFGLWISAATAVPVFVGLGMAALWVSWRAGRQPAARDVIFTPSLWGWWGSVAAIGSLLFYLLEYFPFQMGMRLEVNHPLYALAMWGGGQILHHAGNVLAHPDRRRNPSELLRLAVGILACAVLPVFILIAPNRFFWVADKFLWLLHVGYIQEFRTFWALIHGEPVYHVFSAITVIPAAGAGILWMFFQRNIPAPVKALLVLALVPTGIVTLLGLSQIRWMSIAAGLWFVPFVVWLYSLRFLDPGRTSTRVARIAAAGLTVLAIVEYPQYAIAGLCKPDSISLSVSDATVLTMRDIAHRLRGRTGDRVPVVLSGPTTTTWLMYYGGMKGVGTLYWENLAGLKAAAAMNAATSPEEAFELLKKHGVTHVVICQVDVFAKQYTSLHRAANGIPDSTPAFLPNLIDRLAIPQWLLPLHYPTLKQTGGVLVLEIHPDQTMDQAYAAAGKYYIDRNEPDNALVTLTESLRLNPNQPEILSQRGLLLIRLGKSAEGIGDIERGAALLPPEKRPDAFVSSANGLFAASAYSEAVALFDLALSCSPDVLTLKNNVAWLLATAPDEKTRNGRRALALAQEVVATERAFTHLDALAAAQAETGDFASAEKTAREAATLAVSQGQPDRASGIAERAELYSRRQPFRLNPPKPPEPPASTP